MSTYSCPAPVGLVVVSASGYSVAWEDGIFATRDLQHCEDCKYRAQLEEERTQPCVPCPKGDPAQLLGEANIESAPSSNQRGKAGFEGLVEDRKDADLRDKMDGEIEL